MYEPRPVATVEAVDGSLAALFLRQPTSTANLPAVIPLESVTDNLATPGLGEADPTFVDEWLRRKSEHYPEVVEFESPVRKLCDEILANGVEATIGSRRAKRTFVTSRGSFAQQSAVDDSNHTVTLARETTKKGKTTGQFTLIVDGDLNDPVVVINEGGVGINSATNEMIDPVKLQNILTAIKGNPYNKTPSEGLGYADSALKDWMYLVPLLGSMITVALAVPIWSVNNQLNERRAANRPGINSDNVYLTGQPPSEVAFSNQFDGIRIKDATPHSNDFNTSHPRVVKMTPRVSFATRALLPDAEPDFNNGITNCRSFSQITSDGDRYKAITRNTQPNDHFSISIDAEKDEVRVCRIGENDLPDDDASKDDDQVIVQKLPSQPRIKQ